MQYLDGRVLKKWYNDVCVGERVWGNGGRVNREKTQRGREREREREGGGGAGKRVCSPMNL